MPSAVAASTGWPVTRAPCIATCRLIAIAALDEFLGLSRMATRVAVGATLCSISTSLPLRSVLRIETPVMLCPGRPRLSTKPLPTGSLALAHAQRERAEAAAFERLGALRQRHESHAPTALLLREGARPRADRRKCDRRNECASVHHSITSSARRTRPAGTSYPSAFAALRLITS